MRELLIDTPSWAIALVLFIFFAGVSLGCRAIIRKRCSEKRCEELSDESSRLLTGLAATFAFFIGFAVTVTWGAVATGQDAVENQAARAQQMSWNLNNIPNQSDADPILKDLQVYLATATDKDGYYLARGDTTNLPSMRPFDAFQDAVHKYAYSSTTPGPEVSGLVTAASNLTNASASVSAVAQRSLPLLLAILLLVTGTFIAIVMGISTTNTSRPLLLTAWCIIPALSITVIAALAFPFAGDISVDLSPIKAVAEQMANHP